MMALGFLHSLGSLYRLMGEWEEARHRLEWEVETARSVGYQQRTALRLHDLARLEYDLGNFSQAEEILEEAVEIAKFIDFIFIEALILCQMGHTAAAQGKPEAIDFYYQALVAAYEQGMNGIALDVLMGLGTLSMIDEDRVTGKESIELLALAASHPNSEWETKMRAQKALDRLEKESPSDMFHAAKENGREANLAEVISALLE